MAEKTKPQIGWKCENCEGTVPMKRNLTREQIGDKTSIIVEKAEEVINKIPEFIAFAKWYNEWKEPRAAGRKVRLSNELSEKA